MMLLAGITSFATDEGIKNGVAAAKEFFDAKPYQDGFTSADYGAAMNLFTQGNTAMFYMGEWEMGMDTNADLPEDFRNNLHAIPFPAPADGLGATTDLVSWNGGGYAVAANLPVKDEVIKFMNWMFVPDNLAKLGWEISSLIPAQKFDTFMTGEEGVLQKKVLAILNSVTSLSGVGYIDALTPAFKQDSCDLGQSFAAGAITPEEFLEGLNEAAARDK